MKDADKLALIQKAVDEIADDVAAGDVDAMDLAAFFADVKAYMAHSADVDEKLAALHESLDERGCPRDAELEREYQESERIKDERRATDLEKAHAQVKRAVEATGHARSLCEAAYREDHVLATTYSTRLRTSRKSLEIVEKQLELAVERESKKPSEES